MPAAASAARPVVACYCATFLKPEMLHIYRQITALERFRPVVIAQKREDSARFPFGAVTVVKKPPTHLLRRLWFKNILNAPWQISRGEEQILHDLLQRAEAALLHIYFGHIAVHLLPLLRDWSRPIVVSFHGADVMVDMEKPRFRYATVQMLHKVRLVLVRSNSLRQALIALGCADHKIRLHRTGIPLDQFPLQERRWPRDGSWQLLQASRLIEKKGLQTTLRAFARFAGEFPQARLAIAGEGPQLAALEKLAGDLKLGGKVEFTGLLTQGQLRDLYKRSHLFLHPSQTGTDGNQEGVPNSMLEAMASGLPVFATDHGGIPEAISNGSNGCLVPQGDHLALAQVLLEAVRNPARLTSLARAGAETVRLNFENKAQVRLLEDLYAEALEPASR